MNYSTEHKDIFIKIFVKSKHKIIRYDYLWVCLLFISFSYDKPIIHITGLYRIDPRPFDLVFWGFLFYVVSYKPRLIKRMKSFWYMRKPLIVLITWFAFIVFYQFFWLSSSYQEYSIFFLLRYFYLFLAVWLVATSSLTYNQRITIIKLFLFTILFVVLIGIFQFTGIINYSRLVSEGSIDMTGFGLFGRDVRITSTLGVHYSYFGQYSVLGIILSIYLMVLENKKISSLFLSIFALLSGIAGIFLSQSLSAIVVLIVFLITLFLTSILISGKFSRRTIIIVLLFIVLTVIILLNLPQNITTRMYGSYDKLINNSRNTDNPITRIEEGLNYPKNFFSQADFQDIIVGRGFYVARGLLGNRRIGYGLHNITLFPLEQSGVFGFFLGLWVFYVLVSYPWFQFRMSRNNKFRNLGGLFFFCWSIGIIIGGQSGQIFWLFESFGNWFIVLLCIWSLLIFPDNKNKLNRKPL